MMNIKNIFYVLLLCVSNACAIIIESDTVKTVLDYAFQPDTLIIFDIDNTIAHPTEELSSDEWFCHIVNKKMAEGHDYITSIYYALPVTYYAQFNVSLNYTESLVPHLIAGLIDHHIPVMALTTRSLFVAERTLEQLEEINVQFLIPHISQEDLVLPLLHPCFYSRSILFASNNDKGEALMALLKHMNYYPKNIVFIDDKIKYIESVAKAVEPYNISFVGIRYSGCDDRVKNFNPTRAHNQWLDLRYKRKN